MKKRKELNALIGIGGDSKRKKTKKGSGHRLLRTEPPDSDSESSSDDDEFSNTSSVGAFGKRSGLCYSLCAFVVLAACVVACAGLVWMQIALKEELDSLKEKFHTMDSGQKASAHELPRLGEELKDKERVLEDIVAGDRGLNRLWANLTEINRKISALDSAVSHLKANIKSASDLINLPTTVEELQKSVATMGSTLTSVQHDVRAVQSQTQEQQQALDTLRRSLDRDGKDLKSTSRSCSTCPDLKQELLYLQDSLAELNSTQLQLRSHQQGRLNGLGSSLSNLSLRVSSLETGLLLLGAEPGMMPNASSAESRPTVGGVARDSAPREGVGPAESGSPAPAPASSPTRRPAFLSQSVTKKDLGLSHPEPLSFPGVHSLSDFEELFAGLKEAPPTAGLTYEELSRLLGEGTPDSQALEPFDRNGDQRFSKAELQAAAGL